ncbi:MAG: hypothetical protein GX129_00430 [Clostridiales bacterium]|nr:hypothetical protein [Clostridiales bacterium]
MRNFLSKYRTSKFRCFLNGLIFAGFSMIAMFLCVNFLMDKSATRIEVLIPFALSIISMLLGFASMFKTERLSKNI